MVLYRDQLLEVLDEGKFALIRYLKSPVGDELLNLITYSVSLLHPDTEFPLAPQEKTKEEMVDDNFRLVFDTLINNNYLSRSTLLNLSSTSHFMLETSKGAIAQYPFRASIPWLILMHKPQRVKDVLLPVFDMPITHLTFAKSFNKPLTSLPPTLTHLTFGDEFDCYVDYLPYGITHLTFSGIFNQTVDYLPETVTDLIFSTYFNQKVDSLPPNLLNLEFGLDFNHSVDFLPLNLTQLTLGNNFNRKINSLPDKLKYLTFRGTQARFNQKIDSLPHSLLFLILHNNFNQPINLPPSLLSLRLGATFKQPLLTLPQTLQSFSCHCSSNVDEFISQILSKLPSSLTYLEVITPMKINGMIFNGKDISEIHEKVLCASASFRNLNERNF